jgi:peptidyl-prolyl cis-trans isomerase D
MLERMKEGMQGPWAMIIVALIVLSFVFTGVGSYLSAPAETAAAKVNGEEIAERSVEVAYQNERARLESQFGEGISALFANPEYLANFKQGVLDRLIDDKLIEQKARELGLRTSDAQVRETILSMPEFQVGGQFNNDRYLALIRQNGFQADSFREYMRTQMTKEQLSRALVASSFATTKEAAQTLLIEGQARDAKFVEIDQALFADSIEVTEEQITQYYQTNIERYDTQARTSAAYVELKAVDILPSIEVTDEELQEAYQLNIADYRTEEQRRVSHILIELDDTATIAEVEAKLAAGEDFAELAKTYSIDTFSGENGGDLEYITQGDFDPVFDAAAFALSRVGQVSAPVTTESGVHFIKLTELTPEVIQPFADVVADVTEKVKAFKASERFFELQTTMANLAFEVPDTLEDVAFAVDRPVVVTDLFTRANAPEPINHPVALNNAFSAEFIDENLNSDIIEIGDEHIIVMRIAEHEPQRTQSLEEVRESVVAALKADLAKDAALAYAQSLVDSGDVSVLAEKSLSLAEFPGVIRNSSDISPAAVERLFALSQPGERAAVALANGNVGLIELVAVVPASEPTVEDIESYQARISQERARDDFQIYIDALKEQAEIVYINN